MDELIEEIINIVTTEGNDYVRKYDLKRVIENYTERDLQMNTSEIYATAMGLSQVDEANFAKVRDFVLKLGGEPCAIFDSLWTHGDEKRMEIVAEARITNSIGTKKVH